MIILTQHDGSQIAINSDLIRYIEDINEDESPVTKTEVGFIGGMVRVQERFDEVYYAIQQRRKGK